jgi:hypothetical protein
MRTTVRLPDDLLDEAKRYALESGRTLTALIEDGLRQVLARRRAGGELPRVELPTYGVGGVRPGVDLDDSAALLDAMEGGDAVD